MATYGAELNDAGIGLARLYGATILMAAVIYWLGGSAAPLEARRALLLALGFAYFLFMQPEAAAART